MSNLEQVIIDTASFQLRQMETMEKIIVRGNSIDLHEGTLRLDSIQELITR